MGLRTPPSRIAPAAMKTKVAAAHEVFRELDAREAADARPESW